MRRPPASRAMSSLLSHSKEQPRIRKSLSDSSPASSPATGKSLRHETLSRLSSSGSSDVSNDTSTNHAESYFLRRENRLSARKRAEEESANNDYKKMYEKALATNQRLKSRLETSRQELAMIQDQLQRAQGRAGDCGSNVLEAEKKVQTQGDTLYSLYSVCLTLCADDFVAFSPQKESHILQKTIADMEEQLKVKGELKMENQRLKDENGALIRVITKLSK
uniref:cGMP-dependent protein kinase interacting domain-containing protein n=1 Tax=Gasterosteus aculeatus aculeatus TaxID=481459 RepID=A0AAQ4P3C5_GASAC